MTDSPDMNDAMTNAPTDYPLPYASHDLTGEVAIVTGATSGLGRRFARVLAASGAQVALAGRRVERLAEVKAEIEAAGGTAVAVPTDMTVTGDIAALVEAVRAQLGTPTILVNNAGMADAKFATNICVDLIDKVLDLNLRGPFILAREVAKGLIAEKREGRIVNISSIMATHYTGEGAALYSVTKAAITRMSEALAVEWAKFGINVNAIAPGYVRSEMTDAMALRLGGGEVPADLSVHYPRGRLPTPGMLDSTLLFLCSPASGAVTGTVVKVDDGQTPR